MIKLLPETANVILKHLEEKLVQDAKSDRLTNELASLIYELNREIELEKWLSFNKFP